MINTGYLFHERRAVQCTCISAFYTLNLKKLKVLIMEKQKGQAFVIAHGCKYEYPSYICNMLTATLIGAQNMVSMWPVNIKLCQLITAPHPLWPWIIKFCVGFYLHVSHQEMGVWSWRFSKKKQSITRILEFSQPKLCYMSCILVSFFVVACL